MSSEKRVPLRNEGELAGARREESARRIAAIREGPWTALGARARAYFKAPRRLVSLALNRSIDMKDMAAYLTVTDRIRCTEFESLLRPHWVKAVRNEGDAAMRDSLDEALTPFQLYELAVESGYLTIEDVSSKVRGELINLLWSEPVRTFLVDYEYRHVRFLARRLGFNLGKESSDKPPRVNAHGGLYFTAFVTELGSWGYGADVTEFLGLLDGYGLEDPTDPDYWEPGAFASFVADGTYPDGSGIQDVGRFASLSRGFIGCCLGLDQLLSPLPTNVRSMYVGLVAYWLAKLHGNSFGRKGYYRDSDLVSWSDVATPRILVQSALGLYEQTLGRAMINSHANNLEGALRRLARYFARYASLQGSDPFGGIEIAESPIQKEVEEEGEMEGM